MDDRGQQQKGDDRIRSFQSSATPLAMPTWIGAQMATITTAAVMGSIAFSRLDSPSIGRTESTSPIQVIFHPPASPVWIDPVGWLLSKTQPTAGKQKPHS